MARNNNQPKLIPGNVS